MWFHNLYIKDFYSHSNWVEMGQRFIYLHLLQPEEPAIPVAKGHSRLHTCDYTTAHFNRSKRDPRAGGWLKIIAYQFSAEYHPDDMIFYRISNHRMSY